MKFIIDYLIYHCILILSKSPFWVLYLLSDFMYILINKLIGYRKDVILSNLRNSFPEKDELEIKKICDDFYAFLCDLFVETLKAITWTKKDVRKRIAFTDTHMINQLAEKNQNFILVLGHLGNWEWIGPCFSLTFMHKITLIYLPLKNTVFDRLLKKSRHKFNAEPIPKAQTLKVMLKNKNQLSTTLLASDQSPSPIQSAHWITFLNQETPVYKGAEKIAKKFNYPVVYVNIRRKKRGYYEIIPTLLTDTPNETKDLEITIAFNKMLEQDIIKSPATWLWSHKRWKHKKPA